jgi:hypothetical protein
MGICLNSTKDEHMKPLYRVRPLQRRISQNAVQALQQRGWCYFLFTFALLELGHVYQVTVYRKLDNSDILLSQTQLNSNAPMSGKAHEPIFVRRRVLPISRCVIKFYKFDMASWTSGLQPFAAHRRWCRHNILDHGLLQ